MTTDERINTIDVHLRDLQAAHTDLLQQLAQARADMWKSRIEALEVQVHLATMSSDERLTQLGEQLRNTWDRTQAKTEDVSRVATTATETLWSGVEHAYRDMRDALLASKHTLQS
ncbi:MAG: hypothetical protein ABIN79_05525 [Marmoricola sp.]